jgi:hypothetical protein
VLFHVVESTYNPLTVTAEVASSSLVVPAIRSKRVAPISLKPNRVQKGAFLHPFCAPFRQLDAFSRVLTFMTWSQLGWSSAVRFRREHEIEYGCLCSVLRW